MSVFASQPSPLAPPSYSRTKIQPPPYKAWDSTPTTFSPIKTATSFNPIKNITRVFTNSNASTPTASISLSAANSTNSSTSTSTSPSSGVGQSPVSSEYREQPSPSIPPPTYSPITSAPKPLTSPPAYSRNPEPRPMADINPRSDTFITQGQVIPSQSIGLTFNYEAEEWVMLREREERRRFDELEASQKEDAGCCSWWWSVDSSPLPWAAYYVF